MIAKYRGKRIDNGEWVYGCYLFDNSYGQNRSVHLIFPFEEIAELTTILYTPAEGGIKRFTGGCYQVIPESVGQFTGLKDKNGKEGYKDDIALCSDGEYGLIVWEDAGWYLKRKSKSHTEGYYSFIDLSYCVGTLEFVDNVHDNPSLLEK